MTLPLLRRFDHLGLVVRQLERGRHHLNAGLGIVRWTAEIIDPINGVRLQFGRDPSGVVYELLEPMDKNSPVYSALERGKGILNHVAYRVPDLQAEQERMRAAGWARTSAPKPARAY